MKRKPPVNTQLDLHFKEDEDKAAADHFVFSITYECVNKWHDKCDGGKCYCLCHYRRTKTGRWVKLSKAEVKEEARIEANRRWREVREKAGLLPGEQEMSDVPLAPSGDPKGFKCQTCKKYHEFDPYVIDHWDERLVHECHHCGSKHAIVQGVATRIREARRGWTPF